MCRHLPVALPQFFQSLHLKRNVRIEKSALQCALAAEPPRFEKIKSVRRAPPPPNECTSALCVCVCSMISYSVVECMCVLNKNGLDTDQCGKHSGLQLVQQHIESDSSKHTPRMCIQTSHRTSGVLFLELWTRLSSKGIPFMRRTLRKVLVDWLMMGNEKLIFPQSSHNISGSLCFVFAWFVLFIQ